MKKADILNKTNEQIVSALLWNQITATKQANTVRGITKQIEREEDWLIDEMVKRFGLDKELLFKELYKL